jgi:hypothetical protein
METHQKYKDLETRKQVPATQHRTPTMFFKVFCVLSVLAFVAAAPVSLPNCLATSTFCSPWTAEGWGLSQRQRRTPGLHGHQGVQDDHRRPALYHRRDYHDDFHVRRIVSSVNSLSHHLLQPEPEHDSCVSDWPWRTCINVSQLELLFMSIIPDKRLGRQIHPVV